MAFRRTRRRECPVKQESLQANLDGLLNLRNVSGVSHLIEQLVQIMQRGLLIQRGIRRSIGSPDMKGGKKRSAWLQHLKPKHRNSIFGFGFSTLSVLTVSVCLAAVSLYVVSLTLRWRDADVWPICLSIELSTALLKSLLTPLEPALTPKCAFTTFAAG
jgi:hypothetical protein